MHLIKTLFTIKLLLLAINIFGQSYDMPIYQFDPYGLGSMGISLVSVNKNNMYHDNSFNKLHISSHEHMPVSYYNISSDYNLPITDYYIQNPDAFYQNYQKDRATVKKVETTEHVQSVGDWCKKKLEKGIEFILFGKISKSKRLGKTVSENNNDGVVHIVERVKEICENSKLKSVFNQQKNALLALKERLEYYLTADLKNTDLNLYERYEKRLLALKETHDNHFNTEKKIYHISSTVDELLTHYKCEVKNCKELLGTKIQHCIHNELLNILEQSALLYQKKAFQEAEEPIFETIVSFADVAHWCNKDGYIMKAMKLSDFCWHLVTMLDPLQFIYRNLQSIADGVIEGGKAIGSGLINFYQAPKECVTDFFKSFGRAALAFTEICIEIENWNELIDEQGKRPPCPTINNICRGIHNHLKGLLEQDPEYIKKHAAMSTEFLANMAIFHTVTSVAKFTTAKTISAGTQLVDKAKKMEFLQNNPLNRLVNRTNQLLSLRNKYDSRLVNNFITVLSEDSRIIQSTNMQIKHIEVNLAFIEEDPHLFNTLRDGTKSAANFTKDMQYLMQKEYPLMLTAVPLLQDELPFLIKKFDGIRQGFGSLKDKLIKVGYSHILDIDVKKMVDASGVVESKFYGLHHDFMRYLENSGKIKFLKKIEGILGTFKADVVVEGQIMRGKSFFSPDWSRKKVIEKILEAYDDFVSNGAKAVLQKNNNYNCIGKTKDGLEIIMIINQEAEMITAYPVI